jgi:hypothetical protein
MTQPAPPLPYVGERMAVDPANPTRVLRSQSMAAAHDEWRLCRARVRRRPDPRVGITGIRFQSSSTLFAAVPGVGVWRSTNAGSTWTRISGSTAGGPVTVQHAAVASPYYYATEADGSGLPTGKVWRYDGSSWRDISRGRRQQSIATDPDPRARAIGTTAPCSA